MKGSVETVGGTKEEAPAETKTRRVALIEKIARQVGVVEGRRRALAVYGGVCWLLAMPAGRGRSRGLLCQRGLINGTRKLGAANEGLGGRRAGEGFLCLPTM